MQPFMTKAILESILHEIDFENYSIDQLVQQVGKYRNLSIVLVPMPLMGITQFGCWLKGPVHDYIFYEANTPRMHQEHIIMHELGHILLGHKTYQVNSTSTSITAMGLMRTMHRLNHEETAAENFAVTLQHEIMTRLTQQSFTPRRIIMRNWAKLFNALGGKDERK